MAGRHRRTEDKTEEPTQRRLEQAIEQRRRREQHRDQHLRDPGGLHPGAADGGRPSIAHEPDVGLRGVPDERPRRSGRRHRHAGMAMTRGLWHLAAGAGRAGGVSWRRPAWPQGSLQHPLVFSHRGADAEIRADLADGGRQAHLRHGGPGPVRQGAGQDRPSWAWSAACSCGATATGCEVFARLDPAASLPAILALCLQLLAGMLCMHLAITLGDALYRASAGASACACRRRR